MRVHGHNVVPPSTKAVTDVVYCPDACLALAEECVVLREPFFFLCTETQGSAKQRDEI